MGRLMQWSGAHNQLFGNVISTQLKGKLDFVAFENIQVLYSCKKSHT